MSLGVKTTAQGLVALINALAPSFTAYDSTQTFAVRGYLWSQLDIGETPAAVVALPDEISRRDLREPEDEIGSRSLDLTFTVTFLFDSTDVLYLQEQALAAVEAFIDAVDAAGQAPGAILGDPDIEDAVVTAAGPFAEVTTTAGRTLFAYPATVRVEKSASY